MRRPARAICRRFGAELLVRELSTRFPQERVAKSGVFHAFPLLIGRVPLGTFPLAPSTERE
jgi:hypothetical protein